MQNSGCYGHLVASYLAAAVECFPHPRHKSNNILTDLSTEITHVCIQQLSENNNDQIDNDQLGLCVKTLVKPRRTPKKKHGT